MSARYPMIWIKSPQGRLLMREGLSICFYMHRSHEEVAQAVMRAVEVYRREVTSSVALGWYVDDEGGWRDLHAEDQGYTIEYRGRTPNITNPDAVSAVCFWLPTDYLETHGPERMHELALELAAPLPFHSGHAGLAFNFLEGLVGVSEQLEPLRLRYPGMNLQPLREAARSIGTQVQGASWLNFLGQPLLGELGGITGLRARLSSPDITVQEMEGGRAIIMLGAWPEAGAQRQLHLPIQNDGSPR